ncbi:MAG: hypothetical protein A2Y17_00185 [Clostridiales bacterium GWF2_38_85]|nr:MAG: hypothetical protein A2Y17_00185 [Clostridiales bacterium GWF2_38_85]HBL83878.1 hypothetical protein [Clostridiales bacterium]
MNEIITSRSNEKIKEVVKLQDKKSRNSSGKFLFEGIKLAEEYINKIGIPDMIYVREDVLNKYQLIKNLPSEKITCVSTSVYDKISSEKSPQGILCVADFLPNIKNYDADNDGGIILESIRDAGNLGTMIRTAAALGIGNIYMSEDCADVYNSKTLRAAMGAIFTGNLIICCDLAAVIQNIKAKGSKVYAAMPRGDAAVLGKDSIGKNDAVVIGNEGEGISKRISEICDALTILMENTSESLNAATAAAIIMWEMKKTSDNREDSMKLFHT